MGKKAQHIEFDNRKAAFQYQLVDKICAGIMLVGSEVKAIREGKVSFNDAYCIFQDGELWVKKLFIGEYSNSGFSTHDPLRVRKLLLTKRELKKLQAKVKEKGYTIIPKKLFLSERGFFKLEIALAKGKKSFDKRQSIKDKDSKRQLDRVKKMNR